MKKSLLFVATLLLSSAVFFLQCKDDDQEIVVPAGTNLLQAALASAPEGSTVRLSAGLHLEDTTVLVSKRICLVGDDGAVLKVRTKPTIDTLDVRIHTAVYLMNAPDACLDNIQIQPADMFGGAGIYLEDSPNARIEHCTISGHQLGIVVQRCNKLVIDHNTITGVIALGGHGIVWINGKNGVIQDNTIKECIFGIWPCDESGTIARNNISYCTYGVIPCKVVRQNGFVTPRGENIFASITASRWTLVDNEVHHNQWGLAMADESNDCLLDNNNLHDNTIVTLNGLFGTETLDIELIGETSRFFLPDPTKPSYNNTVKSDKYPNITIKDCGIDTRFEAFTPQNLVTTDCH